MGHTTSIPGIDQPIWTSYVYYVVLLCPCGHSYYYPSRRQIELDRVTPENLVDEIHQIPERIESRCGKCDRSATSLQARRAVLGIGMPDRSGSILCDIAIEEGEVARTRFRFDSSPDPIQYFREHPDYFKTRPPDNAPLFLDDQLCMDELGRVLNVRSTWVEVLNEAMESGCSFMRVDDGYYVFATTTKDPVEIECQMRDLADDSFWHYFQEESIPRRRLTGVDRWPEKQKKKAGLLQGTYHNWLPLENIEALQQGKVHAMVFSIESIVFQQFSTAAANFEIEIDEIYPEEGGDPEWWIRNSAGMMRRFPPLELLQLIAIYKGRLVADQVWLTFEHLVQSLQREELIFEKLHTRLPPGYSAEWSDPGKLLICRGDHPLEMLTFANIADSIEPTDEKALGRLVSWLISEKRCECNRYVGKRLMSRSRLKSCSSELLQDTEAFIYKERNDDLLEIYTDECEHHTVYGLKMANGDLERAEAMYHRDLPHQRFELRYLVRKSFFRGVQMLALVGRDAASIATHPALLRGVLSDLDIRFGERVRVFAPFNGILTVGLSDIDIDKLEKFAYEIAREVPDQPELKSDRLKYNATLELADEGIGQFDLESYDITKISRF